MAFPGSPYASGESGDEVPVSKHQLKPSVAQIVQHGLDEQGKHLDQVSAQLAAQIDAQSKQLDALTQRAELQSKQIETLNADLNRLTTALLSHSAPANPAESASRPAVQTPSAATEPAAVKAEPAPASAPETGVAPDGSPIHVVKRGENLITIARQHSTTVSELLKINKIEDERKLQIGQTLLLPKPTAPQTTPQPDPQ